MSLSESLHMNCPLFIHLEPASTVMHVASISLLHLMFQGPSATPVVVTPSDRGLETASTVAPSSLSGCGVGAERADCESSRSNAVQLVAVWMMNFMITHDLR